jgi:hypothetical protein
VSIAACRSAASEPNGKQATKAWQASRLTSASQSSPKMLARRGRRAEGKQATKASARLPLGRLPQSGALFCSLVTLS